MPTQIKMNIDSLYTNNVTRNIAPRQVARVVVTNKRVKLSSMFDISTAKSGCRSCGGG